MKLTLLLLLSCLMIISGVDAWWGRRRTTTTTVTYRTDYRVNCYGNCVINGRKKRSADLTNVSKPSLATRTRFTRFTFITSGGCYSKRNGYKRTFELVPVYLSGSFPKFIQYLENRFFLNHWHLLQYYIHFS